MDRDSVRQKSQDFFDDLWRKGDPWALDHSEFEELRYNALMETLGNRRYGRTLEIGCGAGAFTERLLKISDQVLGLDISPTAISKAKDRLGHLSELEFRIMNAMDYDPVAEGPFALIILSETIYYLGWLYPFFDLAWFAAQLFSATASDGKLLLANTEGLASDYLLLPYIIRTYHDLFRNVGYMVESEKLFRGIKDGEKIKVLITLFNRAF